MVINMRIPRNKNKVYYSFSPTIEPLITIMPGDRMVVETFDAAGGMFMDGFVYVRPNPATGPIYVNGAAAGDTLEVEIHDIKLIGAGYMHIPHAKSGISTKFTRNGHEFVKAEAAPDGNLRIINNEGLILPSNPMIGVIGVAVSDDADGEYFTTGAGDYGGNMDNSLIKAGVKIYLPVFAEGALLGVGDVHGAMGDGEIYDQGMEMCADVDITVNIKKDMKINRPLVISDDIISTTATAATIEEASELAVLDMRGILEAYYGLSHVDAGLIVGFYGHLRVCQIINKTMRVEVKKEIIAKITNNIPL
jgi:amidase